jgi:carboxyl-terminal processing protease
MSSKSRWLIFAVSTPLVIVALVGGLLGAAPRAPQQSFRDLSVFEDVIGLIMSAYVERVDIDKVMEGAMRGLADGLDPSSAYLSAEEVQSIETKARPPAGDVGLVLSRQFYLRVVGVRDGSPAARAGIRTGDVIRGIDGKPTREISAFTGSRMLSGAPGTKVEVVVLRESAVEPHTVVLERQPLSGDLVTSKRLASGEAYVRVASFGTGASAAIRRQLDGLRQAGASSAVIDVRGTADGPTEEGVAAARLFLSSGTVATLAGRTPSDKKVTTAAPGDGALTMPVVLLTSNGTANAAEVFAAALVGNKRADLVGEPTAGIAGVQHLVKLSEGRGLWMTYARYLTTDGKPIHEHGLAPTVPVEEPTVTFGAAPPASDDALTKALEVLKAKTAPKAA